MSAPDPFLIALDVDGTILTHDGFLPAATRAAIVAAARAGHHIVLATGRSIVATVPIAEMLDLPHGYAVCSNGAVTLGLDPTLPAGYQVIDSVTFDPRPVLSLLREELPDALIAVEDLGVGFLVSSPFPDGELGGEQTIVPFDELVARPATRVTLRMPEVSAEDFMARVERIGLHEVAYAVGWTAWLDINPEGVSKASALELVRRRLGVQPHRTVAVGDQRNDIQMLQWAARGVAMGNAPEEVKAVADEVTGDVSEGGLAAALRPYAGPVFP